MSYKKWSAQLIAFNFTGTNSSTYLNKIEKTLGLKRLGNKSLTFWCLHSLKQIVKVIIKYFLGKMPFCGAYDTVDAHLGHFCSGPSLPPTLKSLR